MNVLLGTDVDVIEPFPVTALPQAAQWMRCYKTLIFGDGGPQTNEEIEENLRERVGLPFVRSWGIIDKNNLTSTKQTDTPLVAIVMFEQITPQNGYFHVASNRRAWGDKLCQPGLVEQGGKLILQDIFATSTINRASVMCVAANKAARSLALRLGFQKDGYLLDMINVKGKPADIAHFGLLRKDV